MIRITDPKDMRKYHDQNFCLSRFLYEINNNALQKYNVIYLYISAILFYYVYLFIVKETVTIIRNFNIISRGFRKEQ